MDSFNHIIQKRILKTKNQFIDLSLYGNNDPWELPKNIKIKSIKIDSIPDRLKSIHFYIGGKSIMVFNVEPNVNLLNGVILPIGKAFYHTCKLRFYYSFLNNIEEINVPEIIFDLEYLKNFDTENIKIDNKTLTFIGGMAHLI